MTVTPLSPADYFHDFATCSFGGTTCAQYWCDFALWEALLNTHPEPRGIIELGTWKGGFSLYLAAQARARGMRFATFDIAAPDRAITGFIRLDIYRFPEAVRQVLDDTGPCFLFCDGGNKPREMQTFPQMCEEGSIIVAHDWGTEFLPRDVPETLEEIHGDFCDQLGSISRVFRRAA